MFSFQRMKEALSSFYSFFPFLLPHLSVFKSPRKDRMENIIIAIREAINNVEMAENPARKAILVTKVFNLFLLPEASVYIKTYPEFKNVIRIKIIQFIRREPVYVKNIIYDSIQKVSMKYFKRDNKIQNLLEEERNRINVYMLNEYMNENMNENRIDEEEKEEKEKEEKHMSIEREYSVDIRYNENTNTDGENKDRNLGK